MIMELANRTYQLDVISQQVYNCYNVQKLNKY